jgi:hypothetical protein
MTDSREWIPGRLVSEALDVPECVHAIGEAIWLYLYLLLQVGHDGRLCRQAGRIAADLSGSVAEVETWLTRLVEARLVVILNPSPFLAIRLLLWSGNGHRQVVDDADNSGPNGDVHVDVPVSSRSAAAASSNHGEDGGQGEGEALLREVLATIDEADPTEFAKLIAQYPSAVVRRALRRVQTTPPAQIRKSKAALFRYLLTKLA